MLASVSRDDAARLVVEAVQYAVGCTGDVVETVCEATEQMLRALTIAEADEIAAAVSRQERSGGFATQADEDHWRRLRSRLLDRTLTGTPENVPIIDHDLALLCACAERQAACETDAARAALLGLVARTRELLPSEEAASLAGLDR